MNQDPIALNAGGTITPLPLPPTPEQQLVAAGRRIVELQSDLDTARNFLLAERVRHKALIAQLESENLILTITLGNVRRGLVHLSDTLTPQ